MKVWLEDWRHDPSEIGNEFILASGKGLVLSAYGDPDRAKLASAAPDMARLLLAIEWDGGDCAGNSICPSCTADKYPDDKRAHRPGCALLAALVKAGVR